MIRNISIDNLVKKRFFTKQVAYKTNLAITTAYFNSLREQKSIKIIKASFKKWKKLKKANKK